MEKRIEIGLVGDFNEKLINHTAILDAIGHTRKNLPFEVGPKWVPTEKINADSLANEMYDGFWIVPGSPYKNDRGVFQLIEWCRVNNVPLLGSCGGFQYMVVEYARNVLGIRDAAHEENDSNASTLVIKKLACSLKGGATEEVRVSRKDSWLYKTLMVETIQGIFNCSYGVNAAFTSTLDRHPFTFTAFSPEGEPRAFELKNHRLFAATLFQPALASTEGNPNPIVKGFLEVVNLQLDR